MNILPDKAKEVFIECIAKLDRLVDRAKYYDETITLEAIESIVRVLNNDVNDAVESECQDCVRLEETEGERDKLEDTVEDHIKTIVSLDKEIAKLDAKLRKAGIE